MYRKNTFLGASIPSIVTNLCSDGQRDQSAVARLCSQYTSQKNLRFDNEFLKKRQSCSPWWFLCVCRAPSSILVLARNCFVPQAAA